MTLIISLIVYLTLAVLVAKTFGWARKSWYPRFMFRTAGLAFVVAIGGIVALNVWYAGAYANYGW